MKKKKQIILTCGISIFTLLLLFYFLSQSGKEKTKIVYFINQDLEAGEKFESKMISTTNIPLSSSLTQAVSSINTIIGKRSINNLKKGDLISKKDINEKENGIAYPLLEEGKVLYTIALNPEDANGYWLEKGNEILIYIDEKSNNNYSPEDKTIDNNLNVKETKSDGDNNTLSGESVIVERIEKAKIVRIMDENGNETLLKNTKPKMICLEMTQTQAQFLFKAEKSKKIKILPHNLK